MLLCLFADCTSDDQYFFYRKCKKFMISQKITYFVDNVPQVFKTFILLTFVFQIVKLFAWEELLYSGLFYVHSCFCRKKKRFFLAIPSPTELNLWAAAKNGSSVFVSSQSNSFSLCFKLFVPWLNRPWPSQGDIINSTCLPRQNVALK